VEQLVKIKRKYDGRHSLGGRMKQNYENAFKYKLPERMPVIIRLDGRAFHTLTAKAEKPFDKNFIDLMNETAKYLCQEIQGIQLAYIQSDEISLLLHNYKRLNSQSWFDNEIQKMCSISAGLASSYFSLALAKLRNNYGKEIDLQYAVQFDSRCFVLPEAEVVNYFIWRQKDWERNSIQMVAQSLYSHKELHKKNNSELQEMCFQKGENWNNLETSLKRGRCIVHNLQHLGKMDDIDIFKNAWAVDNNIPIFSQDRNYIEKYLEIEE
jgi:tRNA(His) guanylyltransferase